MKGVLRDANTFVRDRILACIVFHEIPHESRGGQVPGARYIEAPGGAQVVLFAVSKALLPEGESTTRPLDPGPP